MGLHQLEQINYQRFGNLYFFTLPVLELLVLLFIMVPSIVMLKREIRTRNLGIAMLMAVMINALLQIADTVRFEEICDGEDYYRFEGYCDLLIMQSFCNIPFVLIGLVVLLIWWPRNRPQTASCKQLEVMEPPSRQMGGIMVEWRILGALVVGIAGFLVGFEASNELHFYLSPNISTMLIPLGSVMTLGIAIVTWKYRRETFSFLTLLAAAGIGGAVLGLILIKLIMLLLD